MELDPELARGLDAELARALEAELGQWPDATRPEAALQDAAWRRIVPDLEGHPFAQHWLAWQGIFAQRPPTAPPAIAWQPGDTTRERSNLEDLRRRLALSDHAAVHRWSVDSREAFWETSLRRLGAVYATPPRRILTPDSDPEDPVWLPGARLNAAATCWRAPEDKLAIVAGAEDGSERRVSYGQLRRWADQVSHGLAARGLQAGDAVALYLPMTVECVAAYLGIVQAGMVVVSVPDSFAPGEVATRLRLGRARAVITVDAFQRAGKSVPMYPKAREAADAMDPRPTCIVIGGDAADVTAPDIAWDDLLVDHGRFEPVACDPQDASNILFSSGTTGEPKAIPWTHLTPFKAAVDGMWHQDIDGEDVVCWPTNIGWMMGPWLIYASLMNGATMALYSGVPTSKGFLDFVRAAGVSVLGVVPAMVRAWRTQELAKPWDLPGVRVFSSTGEASNVPDSLYLMSLAGYRAPIIEYCGGTEIGGGHLTGSVLQPASPATFTTPAMGIDVVVLDDEGRPVSPGGMGQIYLVPPSIGLSQRLLNRDHHEEYYAGCPAGPAGEVLRRHGDEVQVLPGGSYAAQGRADDTMNLGGIKVGSIELERAMDGHPEVQETAAVGIPPAGGGAERLVVFAVTRADPAALLPELQQSIRERLNPLFRIHEVVAVDRLPRTASNKVMRRELRKAYREKVEA